MRNWAGNITFHDQATLHPTSHEELAEIVGSNENVRVRGSAHCFNTIADTQHLSVILDAMPAVLTIDEPTRTATVGAGLNYAQISEFLHSRGWAIHNLASLPHISIAGAIATGTHGSGINNGALHTCVKAFTMMAADGSLRTLTRGKDPEFQSALVGLGVIGIAISFDLEIVPTFAIAQKVYGGLPHSLVAEKLEDILSYAYSVSYFTTWDDDQAGDLWVKSKTIPPHKLFGIAERTEKAHPIFGMDPSACTEQLGVPGPWHLRLSHFRIDATPSAGNELQSEFFVDVKDAPAAFAAIKEISHEFRDKLMVTEIRAIAADDMWLSPAFARTSIAFHCTWQNDPGVPALVALIEAALSPFNFRPHFGKLFNVGNEHLVKVLPRFQDFVDYAQKMDPTGKFRNEFTNRLLGL
jgi:xylitol oxidase